MKLTKAQLKQLIKEELQEARISQEQTSHEDCDQWHQYAILIDRLWFVYADWQPQTAEGKKYKKDLGKILNQQHEVAK